MSDALRHWLMKSEPSTFSWDDLWKLPHRTTKWDGVRNFQARNLLRYEIKKGDRVFFYHSSAEPPAVIGVCEVVREGYPDDTQFDRKSDHYDPKSNPERPLWYMVDVQAIERLGRPVTLPELRTVRGLEKMALLRKGNRMSVQPVTAGEWKIIYALGMERASSE